MGHRDHERTDWEQVLGNLEVTAEVLNDQRHRLQRALLGLEHLVAVLLAELPPERYPAMARTLTSDAQSLDPMDPAREALQRLAAVLHSRVESSAVEVTPHKSLKRGFHWLPEVSRLR